MNKLYNKDITYEILVDKLYKVALQKILDFAIGCDIFNLQVLNLCLYLKLQNLLKQDTMSCLSH